MYPTPPTPPTKSHKVVVRTHIHTVLHPWEVEHHLKVVLDAGIHYLESHNHGTESAVEVARTCRAQLEALAEEHQGLLSCRRRPCGTAPQDLHETT